MCVYHLEIMHIWQPIYLNWSFCLSDIYVPHIFHSSSVCPLIFSYFIILTVLASTSLVVTLLGESFRWRGQASQGITHGLFNNTSSIEIRHIKRQLCCTTLNLHRGLPNAVTDVGHCSLTGGSRHLRVSSSTVICQAPLRQCRQNYAFSSYARTSFTFKSVGGI